MDRSLRLDRPRRPRPSPAAPSGPTTYDSPEPQGAGADAVRQRRRPAFAAAEAPDDWWRLYDDPALNDLVYQALKANTDLRVAAANLAQARAGLRETKASALLPSTTTSGSATYGHGSAQALGLAAKPPSAWTYDAGLDASLPGGPVRRTAAGDPGLARRPGCRAGGLRPGAHHRRRPTPPAPMPTPAPYGQQLDVARHTQALLQQSYNLTAGLLNAGAGTGAGHRPRPDPA